MRILIVDDDLRMTRTLRDILAVKGYNVKVAESGSEALEILKAEKFDCILSDIKMPEMDGVELFRRVIQLHGELPFVLMTAYASDILVQTGMHEGVITTLTKPFNLERFLLFLTNLQKARRVIIIDDDPIFGRALLETLEANDCSADHVLDSSEVKDELTADAQVIVLLDMKLKGKSGLEALQELQARYTRIPVLLITGYKKEMEADIAAALKLGAFDCLHKPIQTEELLDALQRIRYQEFRRLLDIRA